MPAPLKILVVHNDYQQHGGETAAIDAQTDLLRRRGHPVVVYRRHNDDIRRFSPLEFAAFLPRTIYSRRTVGEIVQLIDRERPDVAHVHNVFPLISPSVYRALRRRHVPIVQTVHNFRLLCPNGLFYTHGVICERCLHGNTLHAVRLRCYRDSYALSGAYALSIGGHRRAGTFALIDHVVAPAAFGAEKLIEGGVVPRDRVTVIDHFLPDPLPQPGSFDRRAPYFLYIGRLSEEKGIWTLMQAMRALPNLALRVMGSGPLEMPIRHFLATNGMRNVEVCGFVSGEAKWDALRSAAAVIVPSHCYDTSPVSVVESLTLGTPVIAPRLGNFPVSIAHEETGLLFERGDSDALGAAIAWMATHGAEALAMGRRARAVAEQRYSEDAHYRRLTAVYARAAG